VSRGAISCIFALAQIKVDQGCGIAMGIRRKLMPWENFGSSPRARMVRAYTADQSSLGRLATYNAFPPAQRSKGIDIWAGVGTVGLAIGPLVGGFLTETSSWRWFFFVNIPVAVLAMFLTMLAVRESRDETVGRRVDLVVF
jgi:MFS family permease